MPGVKNIFMGIGWAILGLLITGITYAIAPGGKYIVAYGAVIVGAIQFLIGIFQFVSYKLKGPEGKARAHTEATVQAILQAMIATSIADGEVQNAEIEAIVEIYKQIFNANLEPEFIKNTANKMLSNSFDIEEALSEKHVMIESSLKPLILKGAYFVAAADGSIGEKEKDILLKIAAALRMTEPKIVSVFEELKGSDT